MTMPVYGGGPNGAVTQSLRKNDGQTGRPVDTFWISNRCENKTSSSLAFGQSTACQRSIFRRRVSDASDNNEQTWSILRLRHTRGRESGRNGSTVPPQPRALFGLHGKTTAPGRSPYSGIEFPNQHSGSKSTANRCARTSGSMHCSSWQSTSELNGFLDCRSRRGRRDHNFPLRSPDPVTKYREL